MTTHSATAKLYTGIRTWCVDKNISAAITSSSTVYCLPFRIKRTVADLEAVASIGLTNERYKTYGGGNNVITPGPTVDNTNNWKINSSVVCKFPTYLRIDVEKLQLPEGTDCVVSFEEGWILEGDFPGSTRQPSPEVAEFFTFRTPWYGVGRLSSSFSLPNKTAYRIKQLNSSVNSSASIMARPVFNPGKLAAIEVSTFTVSPSINYTARTSSAIQSSGAMNFVPLRIKQLDSSVNSQFNFNLPEFEIVIEYDSELNSLFAVSPTGQRVRYLFNQTMTSTVDVSTTTADSRRRNTGSNLTALSIFESRLTPYIREVLTIKNIASNPSSNTFSADIAMDGNNIVLGCPDSVGNDGVAYVYNATTGALISTLVNPNKNAMTYPFNPDNFGTSVAVYGNYAVVGSIYEDGPSSSYKGAAYVYNITTGALVYTLTNPNNATDYYTGLTVAIDDNYIVVGQARDGVLVYSLATGSLVRTLSVDSASGWRNYSVDISGDNIIVGTSQFNSSSYKLYQYSASTGNLIRIISNPNPYSTESGDRFGSAVAVYGNYAIVGSSNENNGSGRAYLFDLTTGNLLKTIGSQSLSFGLSVDISNRYIIISAEDSVNVYDINGNFETSITVNENTPPVAISGNKFVAGLPSNYDGNIAGVDGVGKVKVYSF